MDGSDGMTLHDNGTATVLGITLRRPTVGEFRKLRESLWATQETVEAQRDVILALTEETDESKRQASAKEANRLAREMNSSVEEANIAWLREVARMLGDGAEIPADDDLPMWCAETETRGDLFTHWKTRPVSPGVR